MQARWFRRVQPGAAAAGGDGAASVEESAYEYCGGYWEARQSGSWGECRQIFA
jgi:hypothetical protein